MFIAGGHAVCRTLSGIRPPGYGVPSNQVSNPNSKTVPNTDSKLSVAPDTVAPDTVAPDTVAPNTVATGTVATGTVATGTSATGTSAPNAEALTVVAPRFPAERAFRPPPRRFNPAADVGIATPAANRGVAANRPVLREGFTSQLFPKIGALFVFFFFDFIGMGW
jgi:hypothetical protein